MSTEPPQPQPLTEAHIRDHVTYANRVLAGEALVPGIGYFAQAVIELAGHAKALEGAQEWRPTHRDRVHGFEIRVIEDGEDLIRFEWSGRATSFERRQAFVETFEPLPAEGEGDKCHHELPVSAR